MKTESQMRYFLFRRGDGNQGNYPRAMIALQPGQCAYAALRAVLVNEYIPNSRTRRHIIKTVEIDGEEQFGIMATVHEGPDGSTAYGAAFITAEFEPYTPEEYKRSPYLFATRISELDRGSRAIYRKHCSEG